MNTKQRNLNGYGDCFPTAAKVLIQLSNNGADDSYRLVHGLVTSSSGNTKGITHTHAWVEKCDMIAIDMSNNNAAIIPVDDYYALGKITTVKKYKPKEALELLLKHKHYGPWDTTFDNYI